MLQILNELSVRELALLEMLDGFECALAEESEGRNLLQRATLFWANFTRERTRPGHSENELSGVLARLPRTGCYAEITGDTRTMEVA